MAKARRPFRTKVVDGRRAFSSPFKVVRLATTPIKGLALHHPDSVRLTPTGVVGDREFYLVDAASGRVESCTSNPALFGLTAAYNRDDHHLEITRQDEVLLAGTIHPARPIDTDMWGLRTVTSDIVEDPMWGAFFSGLLHKSVFLVHAREPAFDVHPVTLVGTRSVDELGRQAGIRVDSRRFRMLIEFSGGVAHLEDTWEGSVLSIGDTLVRCRGPVKRCAATTRNPETGAVDLQTLRLITSYRGRRDTVLGVGATFGVYGQVIQPGTIAIGDALTVLPGPESPDTGSS